MSLRIHFARHGESQANLLHEISNRGLKHGLTSFGRRQALTLAQRFRDGRVTRIYSSPLLRAIETSVILAVQLNIEYEITDALREYDCGVLEGRSDAAAWAGWQSQYDAWMVHRRAFQKVEGGESYNDIQARFTPFIADLIDRYGTSDIEIICVSHGGLYMLMLPDLLANIDAAYLSRSGFKNTDFLTAELRKESLYALEWNGQPLVLG